MSLRPYQREGVERYKKTPRFLFAYEPGTGKTRTACTCVLETDARRVLVLAPKNALAAWQDECERAGLSLAYLQNTGALKEARMTFVTYGSAKNESQRLFGWVRAQKWDLVIADEADIMKNPETDVSKAYALDRAGVLQRSDRVLLLTGTPIRGRVREFYPLLVVLRRDGMTFSTFLDTFCKYDEPAPSGASGYKGPITRSRAAGLGFSNRAEFSRILDQISQYVPKQTDLPPLRRVLRRFTVDSRFLGAYERAAEKYMNLLIVWQNSIGKPDEPRWRAAVRDARCNQLMEANYVRNLPMFRPAVERAVSESKGTNALIFVEHHASAQAFKAHLEACGVSASNIFILNGQSDAEERARVIRFLANPENKDYFGVFSLRACGVAATLSPGCTRVYFAEISFSPGDHVQAENRIHRLNSTQPSHVEYWVLTGLLCAETIEKIHGEKMEQQQAMYSGARKTPKQIYEERFHEIIDVDLRPAASAPQASAQATEEVIDLTGDVREMTVREMLMKRKEQMAKRRKVGA